MLSGKKLIIGILLLILSLPGFTQTGQAKSLYAITYHWYSTISAYRISGNQIQKQIEKNFPSGTGAMAIGLALDPDSATLFVSYDLSDELELINAKTMTEIKNITAPAYLAGLAFDQTKQKLYAVGMGTNQLFVYLWNAATKTLTLEGGAYKTLTNLDQQYRAYGIALDENENAQRLFVTDITNAVKYYSTVDWTYQGSIPIVVSGNQRQAVGIAFYDNGEG